MADKSEIQWTEATWNPVCGCTKVSAGCANCYAEKMAVRLAYMGQDKYGMVVQSRAMADTLDQKHRHWNGKCVCDESALDKPLHWRNPRKIFVCSMGDLFHPGVPDEFIMEVFRVCEKCPQHTFQILTKRPERLVDAPTAKPIKISPFAGAIGLWDAVAWPLPNIWLGTTIENQDNESRVKYLLDTPAKVRFVSAEPLLGPLDLTYRYDGSGSTITRLDLLDWVIIGPETGPNRRPFNVEWARDLVAQCDAAGVPVFIKPNKHFEWPEDLKDRQEYPNENKI